MTASNDNTKPVSLKTKMAVVISAAVIGVMPLTVASEGTFSKAYQDPAGIWTICTGHTHNVHKDDVATKEQCETYFKEDMTDHMNQVLAINPELADFPRALWAAGDLTFNTGNKGWPTSPMSKYSKLKEYKKMCESYVGYYTGATYNAPQKGLKCQPHKGKPGKFLCELPGLVTRRLAESKLCLRAF